MFNAKFTKDHTVRYIASVLVNTWGRMKAEFQSVLEEVVSVVTTVLQMVKTISRTPQGGGFSDNKAPREFGCP